MGIWQSWGPYSSRWLINWLGVSFGSAATVHLLRVRDSAYADNVCTFVVSLLRLSVWF